MYLCVSLHVIVFLDALKLQFVETGVPEALSEMIRTLQGGSDTHDLCSIKVASNLIVTLLLGGTSLSMTFARCLCHYGNFYKFNTTICVCLQMNQCRSVSGKGRGESIKMFSPGCSPQTLSCSCQELWPLLILPEMVRR